MKFLLPHLPAVLGGAVIPPVVYALVAVADFYSHANSYAAAGHIGTIG